MKHLLARSRLQYVNIVTLGKKRLNIYFYFAQNGQQNASVKLVTRLT